MIELHCHILPGLDDGARNLAESVEMAKVAVEEGITTIVATPHHKNGQYTNEKQTIDEAVVSFQKALTELQIPLQILPGQEVRLYGELLEDKAQGFLNTLADSKYILVEFPSNHIPRYAEKMLYDLQLAGVIPIIAHPERNAEIMENPTKLYDLVKKGAYTQITASSVTGHFGKKIKKFSLELVEHNLTQFIASDAHNVSSRGFHLREAYNVLEKQFGQGVHFMYRENAELLVNGKAVYKELPEKIKKKKFLLF
ncbi:tyrosine protein phosphatase [Bacillus sp. HMF5848]|uniref:tyrosine-protein phosphatase n=1 Tax=Bacillus sp. HMF5848 TaxID=2495421 RepID=UPI000F770383|nr:CpsB/CapC family capsule biosynthesis tyrosine phosphatase [Bacillus sp. HMF5848]RSK28865.1 tyrosine protein phosphatase [Bacillus sp. HMF5848]